MRRRAAARVASCTRPVSPAAAYTSAAASSPASSGPAVPSVRDVGSTSQ
ncbi:Uncharacterised protein [Mycobacteroides abscessus]|nr:Uncharacterised protein [Mycobacteroides abscessus]